MQTPDIPANWPFRSASRHIASGAHLWHVQDIGSGPILLLIHGAGGASHSFRHLIPLLIQNYRVITVDLPGQGFTVLGAKSRCGLDDMAQDIAALMAQERWRIFAVIGHSAGAAIAVRLAEIAPIKAVVGINAALGKFDGPAGWIFPIAARVLAVTPLVAQIFSKCFGTPSQVHQLLASTGSRLDPSGEAMYLNLLRRPGHVGATLAMMAQWNLEGMRGRLAGQGLPCLLITSSNDRAVPPVTSQKAVAAMPNARWVDIPGNGHLVHEEVPDKVATLIGNFLTLCTVASGFEDGGDARF